MSRLATPSGCKAAPGAHLCFCQPQVRPGTSVRFCVLPRRCHMSKTTSASRLPGHVAPAQDCQLDQLEMANYAQTMRDAQLPHHPFPALRWQRRCESWYFAVAFRVKRGGGTWWGVECGQARVRTALQAPVARPMMGISRSSLGLAGDAPCGIQNGLWFTREPVV